MGRCKIAFPLASSEALVPIDDGAGLSGVNVPCGLCQGLTAPHPAHPHPPEGVCSLTEQTSIPLLPPSLAMGRGWHMSYTLNDQLIAEYWLAN